MCVYIPSTHSSGLSLIVGVHCHSVTLTEDHTLPTISHPASLLIEKIPAEGGENHELNDRLWDDDDMKEEEKNPVLKSACKTASSTTMDVEVDDGVDIGVPQLHDYLNDFPALSPLVSVGEGLKKKVAGLMASVPRVFV